MENEITEVEVYEDNENKNTGIAIRDGEIDSDLVIANIDAQEKILQRLIKYVQDNLKPKVDYYSVKKGAKPSLGLPGAEKINDFYKYYPKYQILSSTRNSKEVSYEMECVMHDKKNNKEVGSGVGFCSSLEDKFRYKWVFQNGKKQQVEIDNHINLANTILKMAKKRCYVDATLSSTMASFIFTQDLEDGYVGHDYNDPENNSNTGETKPLPKKQSSNYDPNTYVINGGKYKGKLMKDTSTNYIQWSIDQITDGKFDPEKFGMDKVKYLDMLKKCLDIAGNREKAKLPEELTQDEIEALNEVG